jgi:alkylated DNA repair dioxygenase AlkB
MPSSPLFPVSGELLPSDGSAVLVPDFLSESDANEFFDGLHTKTLWEQNSIKLFGKQISEPRLSTWHAEEHLPYTYSGVPRTPHPWNEPLTALRTACETHIGHTFNGALLNLYRTGQDAMGWHSDDEAVNGSNPVIASISLGAERRFDFRHKQTREVISVVLPHGSLLVMSGACQTHWLHRIAKTTRELQPRINVTFRHLIQI